jgi:predicted deacylase
MKNQVKVVNMTVKSGEKKHNVLEIPDVFPDGMHVEIPYTVFNGANDGPWLHIQVAQHGVEVHALEAVRRVVNEINLDELNGVLVYCLPNPIAFRQSATVMSYDFIPGGMNRIWPGRPDGSLTERMADKIFTNLIKTKAEYVVDFHTGRRTAPVWVFYEGHGISPGIPKEVADKSERMAKVFGAELLYLETEAYGGGNTCRGASVDHGIPGIVPEIGGESHFNPDQVEVAYRGLKNIMIDLGMIPGKIVLPKKQVVIKWIIDSKKITATAEKGGVFIPEVKIADRVSKGDTLGFIYSPRTFEEITKVKSPQDGLVFSIVENPIVVAGQPIARVPEIIETITNK